MTTYSQQFIDGEWRRSAGADSTDVVSSSTEQVVGRVPRGTAADVEAAVTAARRAFDAWSATPIAERADWLEKFAAALKVRVPAIAAAIAHEVGTALGYATKVQAESPVWMLGQNATYARSVRLEEELGDSLVVKEPIGVVGCITPWNYPLHQVVCKVAPALAAGCTVVLKPADLAPLSAFLLADAAAEVGLPGGVLNVVAGPGRVVGEAIAAHPGVDMVSFTGSLAAGRRVAAVAAEGIKKVCLELGGKSAFVVLDDAPLDKAVAAGVNHCMQNSGQTCSAWTRMLVPRARQAEVIERAVAQLQRLTLGDPFDSATRLGPLVSDAQRTSVLDYIETGRREGARLVAGGGRPAAFATGYFVEPTIFADVDNRMTIAQEEIFGPVLAIVPYDSEADAVRIANDSPYGLSGGVWGGTPERAMAVARQMRTGQVDINGGRFNPLAPFGGVKHSGIGREIGPLALDEFFTLKAIQR